MRKIETEELRVVEAGLGLDLSGLMVRINALIKAYGTEDKVRSFNTVDENKIFFLNYDKATGKFTFGLNFLKILGVSGGFGAILSFFGIGTYTKTFELG